MSVQTLELVSRSAPLRMPLQEMLEHCGVIKNIRDKYFAEIPWDANEMLKHAQDAKDGFWRMLDGPHRDLFFYKEATETDDQGLFDKNGEAKSELSVREAAEGSVRYDRKWYFHCYPATRQILEAQGAPVHEYRKLFDACAYFNTEAMRTTLAVATALDVLNEHEPDRLKRYPGSLRARIVGSPVVTRLARYKSKAKGAPVAKLHRDRCAVTCHWISSHPGLCVFDREKRRITVADSDPSKLLMFLSEKLWRATRGYFGTGVLHGASNPAEIAQDDEERFVVVTFVHCKLTHLDHVWGERHQADLAINPADYPL